MTRPLVRRAVALWLLLQASFRCASADDELPDSSLPMWESVETPLGPMRIREFGSPNDPLVVLVHGMMDNDDIRNEWNPVALQLADKGFHVLLPDFHSGPEVLRPERLTGDDFRELMLSTLLHQNQMVPSRYMAVVKPKAVVMGKSWGARMAAEAATLEGVVAAALVVPSLHAAAAANLLPQIKGSLGVFLVKDDAVVDFEYTSKAFKATLGERKVTWVEAEKGGHKLVDEFVAPLVEFVESARQAFVHGDDPLEL